MSRTTSTIATTSVLLVLTAGLLGGCSGAGEDDGRGASGSTSSAPGVATSSQSARAAASLLAVGRQQLDDGDLDAADATFRDVLAVDADNAGALYDLGLVAQTRGDVEAATASYAAALAQDADLTPALYNLAILTETDDLPAAVALYRRVLELTPDDAATHMRLGFALAHLGRRAEARTALARGVALDPAMADVEPPTYG